MSSHFMALLKCFHLNHYRATWIVGINLPLCSAYSDRSSKGERVPGEESSFYHTPSPLLSICMPEEHETLIPYMVIYWKLLLHCVFHSKFDNSSYSVVAAVNTHSPLLKLLSVKESSFPSFWFWIWASMCQAYCEHFAFIISFGSYGSPRKWLLSPFQICPGHRTSTGYNKAFHPASL